MFDKMICPVCGKTEFRKKHDNDICDFCGWENDYYLEEGGANVLSLSEYQKRYHIYVYLNPEYTRFSIGFESSVHSRLAPSRIRARHSRNS